MHTWMVSLSCISVEVLWPVTLSLKHGPAHSIVHVQASTEGGLLGSYEPPSITCGKQKSEPNHFVTVQDLIEGSELNASLEHLEVPSYYYPLYAPHGPPFCYDIIG